MMMTDARRTRPRSPNMQIYRPQLTSVLSIMHRLSGVYIGVCAFALVGWLGAAATGPAAFAAALSFALSAPGLLLLFLATLGLAYHLCNGIRHLIWDTGHGFSLRAIYAGGWAVLGASLVLTLIVWSYAVWGAP